MLDLTLYSSLVKIFPNQNLSEKSENSFTAFCNEPFSFQIAYKVAENDGRSTAFYFTVESDIPINVYSEEYVKVLGSNDVDFPEKYSSLLFPDMLLPKKFNTPIIESGGPFGNLFFEVGETNYLRASSGAAKSLWVTVNEDGTDIQPGVHTVKFSFFARNGREPIGEITAEIEIIGAKLPKQELICTNWLHCDCIADFYGVEIFSDRFFEILESFVGVASKNGMNMVLLPAFTPPLDTHIGRERMTAQLVKVTRDENGYIFDFSLMKRYIDLCRKCGIEYFEHSHLFTQWGAKHCPKVVANVGGRTEKIFGWESSATDPEYTKFLRQYLTEARVFFENEGLKEKVLFHISDEPQKSDGDFYRAALNSIVDLLDGFMRGDALSEGIFYEDGSVPIPIVATHSIAWFVGRCENLWCYYTGGHQQSFSNRLIANSSERNRMIGIQMYYNNVKGFLHWAYNYYYDIMSNGIYDPKTSPEGYGSTAGTSFLVYPSRDGKALQSIRQKVFYEGINDMRALSLFEKTFGREKTNEIIEKYFGKVTFKTEAESAEKLLAFRNEVNRLISEKTGK